MMSSTAVQGSFRDPSGFVFLRDGEIYRQVNQAYREHYDRLVSSGLYDALVGDGLLIPHEEVGQEHAATPDAYKVIKPERVPFVSYPYEWCFSQLKDAALATLEVQRRAFERGMTLKDSSAYNIQFVQGKPVLIDSLSFETYREGQVWIPYRQYCQHFLAPLAIMSRTDIRLSRLLRVFIDGVPLDLAAALLPGSTKLSLGLLAHIHMHAKAQARYADRQVNTSTKRMSKLGFQGLIDSLLGTTRRLTWGPRGTEWAEYYDETNYSDEALEHKKQIVGEFLDVAAPRTVWDMGANTGMFSRVAADKGMQTVSFDIDPACVERSYLECKKSGETNILPLVLDLTNPSPGIGWANAERMSLLERASADAVLALALVHHLAISNNVPLHDVAAMLSRIGEALIIEFVPKSDSQVERLLATREDVFPSYTQECFEREFNAFYAIEASVQPKGTERTIYLMKRKV